MQCVREPFSLTYLAEQQLDIHMHVYFHQSLLTNKNSVWDVRRSWFSAGRSTTECARRPAWWGTLLPPTCRCVMHTAHRNSGFLGWATQKRCCVPDSKQDDSCAIFTGCATISHERGLSCEVDVRGRHRKYNSGTEEDCW